MDSEEENTKQNIVTKRIIGFCIALDIFVIDQLSKWAITEMVIRPKLDSQSSGMGIFEWYKNTPDMLPYFQIKITSFFNIVMAWNTGVSFSMFSNSGEMMPYILIAVALGITALFSIWLWRSDKHPHTICYAMIIGGALGNVIDRARFGAVIDFLDFHVMGYHWPAFNVADMSIVCGISLLIIVSLFFEKEEK